MTLTNLKLPQSEGFCQTASKNSNTWADHDFAELVDPTIATPKAEDAFQAHGEPTQKHLGLIFPEKGQGSDYKSRVGFPTPPERT